MRYISAVLITLLMISFKVFTEDESAPDISTRYEKSYINYYLNEDGTHVESREWAYTALKERGLKSAKKKKGVMKKALKKGVIA
jgi:hypothetical protein